MHFGANMKQMKLYKNYEKNKMERNIKTKISSLSFFGINAYIVSFQVSRVETDKR